MMFKLKSSGGGTLLVELLMIVVGINIALWFEGLAENYKDKEKEQEYLVGLSEDLQTDLTSLNFIIENNESKVELFQSIIPELDNFADKSQDQQTQTIFAPSSYVFFQPADFTYVSMQESGDFHLLSEPNTKRRILRLVRKYQLIGQLQDNYIQAMDAEYIPLMMAKFDMAEGSITDPALASNQVFRNFFVFALQETSQRVDASKAARKEASDLLAEIKTQIR